MKSALYEGRVTHRRHANEHTGHVAHHFDYDVTMALVYLDELDEFFSLHPLVSHRRVSPVWLRRRDYLGGDTLSLECAVRDAVSAALGRRPLGPVAMLAHLRTWGWLFNPVSFYYCFDASGTHVDAVVLEVTSTPWHERHVYVVDANDSRTRFAKEMHVSPFLGMDQDYVMSWTTPAERLNVYLGNRYGDLRLLDASLTLRRREATRRTLSRLVWRAPLQTYGVSASIYLQAWRLARRGAPFHPRRRQSVPSGVEAKPTTITHDV